MIFPLNAFTDFGVDLTLLLSALLGVGFGFMLERGGFGSSKVLAGIFYLKDWRVLKVMFTAIVTAMLGLYLLQGLGLVVMDAIAFRPTFVGAQVVGGLLLGIGFVTAGYCPGTSVVGLVSGKLDALFVMVGIILGIGVFEEFYGFFQPLYGSGEMGQVSLSEWLGLSNGVVVAAVVAMALGAFALVGWLERRPKGEAAPRRGWAAGGATVMAGLLVVLVQFAGPGDARAVTASGTEAVVARVTPLELASWAVEERRDYLVLDLRGEGAEPVLPAALPMEVEQLLDLRHRPLLPRDRVLVVADADGGATAAEVAASLRATGLSASLLEGGAAAWQAAILAEDAWEPAARAWRQRVNGIGAFGGEAPPPPAPTKALVPRAPKKKSGGCS
jgi:rhodanese-related sulfurtransferase